MPFSPISEILDDLRHGRMVVLTDDEGRENEGDLVLPAQFVTPEAVTFMLQNALGYLCLSLPEADCDRLNLHPQAAVNTTTRGTAFTVSIDLHPRHGGTTGVSARERAACIRMAIDPKYGPDDFVRPGHINPLRARDGGVLVRTGQTEGSIDLCRLAGLTPAACIIEIMRSDGEMARVPDLEVFCKKHSIKMCSVAQIIEHRVARESLVRRLEPVQGRPLRTTFGTFNTFMYESMVDPLPHLVLAVGDVGLSPRHTQSSEPTLVRMHRRHLLGDVFGDLDATSDGPTADVLHASMRAIQKEGRGAIVYLRTSGWPLTHEGDLEGALQTIRGQSRLDADKPSLDDAARGPVPMPMREYGVGCQILLDLGITHLRLLSNSPKSLPGLEAFGLTITEQVPLRQAR
ncbi:MAG: 3,4-dihydroxy-2-butanone-4-phosphate synthase [Phycisphaerales bacterium]|nr:3,4-dihydroxy-2-butanone-4-phosphate synthase [Phycisphaerales bacterium]